jgi:hypothetical protein
MTMTSAALRHRLPRDPEEDVETAIYVRPLAVAWDALKVLEIMRRLPPPTPPPLPKNVFLTPRLPTDPPPPWVHKVRPEKKSEKTAKDAKTILFAQLPDLSDAAQESSSQILRFSQTSRIRPRRSIMPWVVFAMCFAIAFGISNDRRLRAELVSGIRAAPARVIMLLHSLAS